MHGWIFSAAVSQIGDMAWYVGLAWSAAQVTSPAGVGLVMGIGALPRALILLFGGALADRLDGRRLMVLANLGRIAVLAPAAVIVAAWGVSLPLLLTVAVLFGAPDAIYTPFVAMAMIGFTAGLASAQLSAAFQQTVEPAFLGRSFSIVNLSDEAFMPVAMVAFGALIGLTSVGLSCLVLGVGSAL
jgi:MFS family permease